MKAFAIEYKAKQYVEYHCGIKGISLHHSSPGMIEFTFPVRKMGAVIHKLENDLPWKEHVLEHAQHFLAYHYSLDEDRTVVVRHWFGKLIASVELVDPTEHP